MQFKTGLIRFSSPFVGLYQYNNCEILIILYTIIGNLDRFRWQAISDYHNSDLIRNGRPYLIFFILITYVFTLIFFPNNHLYVYVKTIVRLTFRDYAEYSHASTSSR